MKKILSFVRHVDFRINKDDPDQILNLDIKLECIDSGNVAHLTLFPVVSVISGFMHVFIKGKLFDLRDCKDKKCIVNYCEDREGIVSIEPWKMTNRRKIWHIGAIYNNGTYRVSL